MAHAARLPHHGRLPLEPQPGQVLVDGRFELGVAALGVNVLDPQQKAATRRARQIVRDNGREGVSEVQQARGARREARDDRIRHDGPL